MNNNKKLYAFFIDYSKAFDCVIRESLWVKLYSCGVSGRMLNIITSMYKCVKTRVFVNGEKTEYFTCRLGVRQGECLSPFLFAIYINDMENALRGENAGVTIGDLKLLLLFYADDVIILSEDPQTLQEEINKLYMYCNKWKLKLNTDKSQILVFKKGNRPFNYQWFFGNEALKCTTKIPYLGIIFSANGSFNQAQIKLSEQANKAIFMLQKKLQRFGNLKPELCLDLFDKMILPILTYGSEVWGFHSAPQIERVHLKFCKRILGVRKVTQNDFVYCELGRYPIQVIRHIKIIKYWLNIVHGNKSYYVSYLYQHSVADARFDVKTSWASSVKSLLLSIGFGDVWYNQGLGDIAAFVNLLKQRLFDMYRQNVMMNLGESSRARFYRAVRQTHLYQPYLNIIPVKSHRIALTRLITSSHHLKIETGRWARPIIPQSERICPFCPGKQEDEFHLLLECSSYRDIRQRFIPRYYTHHPSMLKTVQLLNTSSNKLIKALGKFVFLAFKIRTESLRST